MSLFEKIKEKSRKRSINNYLTYELCDVIDVFVDIREKVSKKRISTQAAIEILTHIRDGASEVLENARAKDKEIAAKYEKNFEDNIKLISKYIDAISSQSLTV
jgi:hypothetical protein